MFQFVPEKEKCYVIPKEKGNLFPKKRKGTDFPKEKGTCQCVFFRFF